MVKHEAWLFVWFFLGALTYILKRGYYLITGPNPVATTWAQFLQRCWIPLLVRLSMEAVVFWALFTPQLVAAMLDHLNWSSYAGTVRMITQFAPVAFMFGHAIDSIADMAVSKIPFLNQFLPQMPGPLKPAAAAPPSN